MVILMLYQHRFFQDFNPFQPSVAFHIETIHLTCSANRNDWFIYEMKHWAEIDQ